MQLWRSTTPNHALQENSTIKKHPFDPSIHSVLVRSVPAPLNSLDNLAFINQIIYGCRRLHIYLCILFNLFLMHGYVPDAFCQSTVIPLIKCKPGDLSDVNNYRAVSYTHLTLPTNREV